MNRKRTAVYAGVAAVALAVRIAGSAVLPLDTRPDSDPSLLVGLAGSLADGKGYQLTDGIFWTNQPTICRSPGWPALVSVPFRCTPAAWRWRTAQAVNVLFDTANAVLIVLLALRLGASLRTAGAAGLVYALNPVLAMIAVTVCRDSIGYTFVLLFLAAVSGPPERRERPATALVAGLLLGCACMIRNDWYLAAFAFAVSLLWMGRRCFGRTTAWLAVFTVAVLIPLAPWQIRNAGLFHRFPVFGGGGGEGLWGGNNDRSADMSDPYWGYFIFPNQIPGERPLWSIALEMNELEGDDYYRQKGMKWIRDNPGKMPALLLGKVVRAYVPIPRTRSPMILAGSAYRWLLYGLGGIGLFVLWKRRKQVVFNAWFLAGAASVWMSQLLTVLIFCGYFQYVQSSELLLSLPAGLALASWSAGGRKGCAERAEG